MLYLTQGLHRAANLTPASPATVCGARRRTWRETVDRVARLAGGLRGLGLERGARVAVLALNSDLYIELYYAVAWAGGVIVPANTRWTLDEHRFALADSEPHMLVLDRNFRHLAPTLGSVAGVSHVLLLDADEADGEPALLRTEDLIAANDPAEDVCGRGADLLGLFYTGGTTGRSKGVMLSHEGVVSNCVFTNATAPYPDAPVFLHAPPMFHLADYACMVGVTLCAGAHVVIPQFEPAAVAQAIEAEQVNALVLVPTMLAMLQEHLQGGRAAFASVLRIRYGASPISEAVLRRAMAMFPNADFVQAYGQTELSPVATVLEPKHHRLSGAASRVLRSAGRAIQGMDVRVVDEAMRSKPPGEVGEVVARGPGVMLGYWRQAALTRDTIVDGWLRTGDAGYLDEMGFLYLVDRVKDMIVTGGENVYSAEVENALAGHAAVAECAVIGVPDALWGERVHAVVRLKPGASASGDDLLAHCAQALATYKRPRSVEFRSEPLPLSAAGKILKTELRSPHWRGRSRAVS